MSFRAKACRLCLAIDKNMIKIEHKELTPFIKTIFHETGYLQDVRIKTCVCFECKALIIKFYNFIQRISRAQNELLQLDHFYNCINFQMLKDLNRNQLDQNLHLDYNLIKVDYIIDEDVTPTVESSVQTENKACVHCISNYDNYDREFKVNIEALKSPQRLIEDDDDECYVNEIEETEDIEKRPLDDPFNEVVLHIKENNKSQLPLANVPTNLDLKDVKILTDNEITLLKRGRLMKSLNKKYKDDSSDNEEESISAKKPNKNRFRKRSTDEEFDIRTESQYQEEESSSEDSFDDNGKQIKRSQMREYPRKCDHCNYIFDTGKFHYKHYLIHHPNVQYPYLRERPHLCEICGRKSATLGQHEHHKRTHGEKTIPCPHCERKYYNTELLHRHIYTYHNKTKMICDYCNKCFKHRQDITLHIRTHTGEKPFKCPVCEARFAHKGNVKIHLRSHQHEGRKPRDKTTGSKNKAIESKSKTTKRITSEIYETKPNESKTKSSKAIRNKCKTKRSKANGSTASKIKTQHLIHREQKKK